LTALAARLNVTSPAAQNGRGLRAAVADALARRAADAVVSHPMSQGQQALWFLHHLAPESRAYTLSIASRLTGPVDPDRIRAVVQALVDRHPALRTSFRIERGAPVQVVRGHSPVRLERIDVSDRPADEPPAAVEAAAARPLDIGRGGGVRAPL